MWPRPSVSGQATIGTGRERRPAGASSRTGAVISAYDSTTAAPPQLPHAADIVRVRGITTFSRLIAEHGCGRGCDICKPVVASILVGLGA